MAFKCWNEHGKGNYIFWRSKKDTVTVTKTLAPSGVSKVSYEAFVLLDRGASVRPKNIAFDVSRQIAIRKAKAYMRKNDRC